MTRVSTKKENKGAAKPKSSKASSFTVKTKDYQETFTNLDDARSKYEDLKSHAIKNKQATKVKLSSRIGSEAKEICSVDIKEDHFENE